MDTAPLLLKSFWELSLVEIWTLIKEGFNWLLNQPVWMLATILLGYILLIYSEALLSKWGRYRDRDAYKRKRDRYRDQYK